jgi:transposase
MAEPFVFVGIDVSKARLDLALRPMGHEWSVPNDDDGITTLVERLQTVGPTLIVLEATGGLELPVAVALAAADLPVVVVNPCQARYFAKATGKLAKTDRIAAGVLAHFAKAVRPEPRALPDAQSQALSGLLMHRRQLIDMLTAEKNRLNAAAVGLHPRIQAHIHWLEHELQDIDTELGHRIRSSPIWRAKENLLQSVPGVGPVLSGTLVAQLPELGTLNRQEIAALFGRRRSPQPRQWHAAWKPHCVGWASPCPRRPVHGGARRRTPQSCPQGVLYAPAHSGQGR